MTRGVWRHLRGNLVGYLTIFLALTGGVAYATHPDGANTISSVDIIDGTVRAKDFAKAAIAAGKLAPDAVNAGKVVDDSLGAKDVRERTLALATEWNEVGDADGPAFNDAIDCVWENFDSSHDTAAFMRDRSGTVHLKGLVNVTDGEEFSCGFYDVHDIRVFVLPPGFRPPVRTVSATIGNGPTLVRLNIDGPGLAAEPAGAVSVDPAVTLSAAAGWISLDGVSFRCAPSGVSGCP